MQRSLFALMALLPLVFAGVTSGADDAAAKDGKKLVVFIAGNPSHGFAQHEHHAGCELLAKCLHEGMPQIETKVYTGGWPQDPHALDGADAVVMYCDGGPNHMVVPHLQEMDALAQKGVGIGCIHYAVEVVADKGGKEFLNWIGGYFEAYRSINPEWNAKFTQFPDHPVSRGVHPFTTHDEWYYHMHFRDNMEGVTGILAAVPPPHLHGSDMAHNGSAELHDPNRHEPEVLLWVSENPQTHQRGFGCTGGHFHFNWAQDDYRKTVLNAITWIAKAEVPKEGVVSTTPTAEGLMENLDNKPKPKDFTPEKLTEHIKELNAQPEASK